MVSYLIETSVITRLRARDSRIRDALQSLRQSSPGVLIGRCTLTDLEIGFSAQNVAQWDTRSDLLAAFTTIAVTEADIATAIQLQRRLAGASLAGRKVPDLIIAATAITNGLTLVHYDRDFEHIATISALQHQWIVPSDVVD